MFCQVAINKVLFAFSCFAIYTTPVYGLVLIFIVGGIAIGGWVWYALPNSLFKNLLILAIATGDIILITRILSGGHK